MNAAGHGGHADRPVDGGRLDAGGPARPQTMSLGMAVFLASLTMLFGASLVAFGVIRWRAETWPPPGAPSLPWELWISTALLVACSFAIHTALRGIRAGDRRKLIRWLTVTVVLGAWFLVSQAWCWNAAFHESSFRTNLYGFLFYMLTVLHALHVVGGLAGAAFVKYRAERGAYGADDYAGVRNCVTYWHYLDVVWLVLFGVLLLGT